MCAQEKLVNAVEECGFGATLQSCAPQHTAGTAAPTTERLQLRVTGMTCSACASAVEGALQGTKGVVAASVNLITGVAEVCVLTMWDCSKS